jgi:hypothetical protein
MLGRAAIGEVLEAERLGHRPNFLTFEVNIHRLVEYLQKLVEGGAILRVKRGACQSRATRDRGGWDWNDAMTGGVEALMWTEGWASSKGRTSVEAIARMFSGVGKSV